jgi:hypothetical protein
MAGTTFAAGIAVLAVVTFDIMMTTVGTAAARLTVSVRIASVTFRLIRLLSRLGGTSVLTQVTGVAVMFSIFVFWVAGTWLGWTLIYAAFDGSVRMGPVGQEPEIADVAGHTGHLLSTLGGATTEPGGPAWNVLGTLVGVNGMVVLPLGVSFLLSTRQTVRDGRAFAALEAEEAETAEGLTAQLADVIAGLDSSPFALWYGHIRPSRRLPDAMLTHARRAEERGGALARRTRRIMADLPMFDPPEPVDRISSEAWMTALEQWAGQHQLHERQRDGEGPRDGRAAVDARRAQKRS